MAFDLQSLKNGFFDRDAVLKAVDAGRRKGLSRFGAFVRTRARSSIRKRKAVSAAGSPPSAHTGDIKKIYFAYDPTARGGTAVVGPVLAGSRDGSPARLEKGGTLLVRAKGGGTRVTKYRPRPFMGPALEAERPKFADSFRGTI